MIQTTYIYLLQGYIVEELKNKMKYLRNAKPKAMKREAENMEDPKPKKKRAEPKQFPHNPTEVPEMPVGEDVESCERNIKFLQKEEKKKVVNHSIIENLMQRTFAFRRREIIDAPTTIINVLKRYPSLKRPQQVNYCAHACNIQHQHDLLVFLQILAELERVMGKSVHNTWDKMIPKILMASKLDASAYLSAMCNGECLEGKLHASDQTLIDPFLYMCFF